MFLEKKKRINVKPKSQFDLELSHKFFFFWPNFVKLGFFFQIVVSLMLSGGF
jgi:aminopeptidase C